MQTDTPTTTQASRGLSTERYWFRGFYISEHMLNSLNAYIQTGRPVGGFLTAVLTNDFAAACQHADDTNLHNLPAFAAYLYNEAPMGCHGDTATVQSWIEQGGLDGLPDTTA